MDSRGYRSMRNRQVTKRQGRVLRRCLVLWILCVSGYTIAQTGATVTVSQPAPVQLGITWSSMPGISSYQLLVDDTPAFLHPLFSKIVSQTSWFARDAYDFGFVPGVTYYVRVQP